MALKKSRPRYPFAALWRRHDSMLFQNVADCLPSHRVAKIEQRPAYRRVAPTRVLTGHSYGQLRNLLLHTRSAWPALCATVILPGYELAMPRQNCVWSNDRRHLSKHSVPQRLALRRQTPPFLVGEPNPFAFQLRLENLVLFLDVRDHIELMPVDPAR